MSTVAGNRLRRAGFTLIELLAVVAIVGILAAILIPTVSAVRVSAGKARTRVLFNQWSAALEAFRGEYGYYPALHGSLLVNGGATSTDHPFHDVLAGRRRDGAALDNASAAAAQNRKRISFYAFAEAEFTPPTAAEPNLLRDAFDNVEIAVLVDRNLDGVITAADCGGSAPAVRGLRPDATDLPAEGIRAGVVFYAPTPDATTENPRFIFSWK